MLALAEPLPVPKPPGPGGSCPFGYLSSGAYCIPSQGAGRHRQAAEWLMSLWLARERQLLPAQRRMIGLNCSPVCVLCGLQG